MNTKIASGVAVVPALLVVGWWYWGMTTPTALAPVETGMNPEENVNGVAESDDATRAKIVGSWKSTENPEYVVVFTENTYNSAVNPNEGLSGEWSFVESAAKVRTRSPVIMGGKLIKIELLEETLYFVLTDLSDTNLTMTYLSGESEEFTRI
jgi:hypothetical protein